MSMKNSKIKRDVKEPLYTQIVERLKADIAGGKYKPGAKIPTELELCETYSVSRITVRKAVEILCDDGILTRHQGKGTFVTEKSVVINEKPVNSFHLTCELLGKKPSSKVIGARTVKASAEDVKHLKVAENARVVEIDRLRFADGEPVMIERNHFTTAFSYLIETDLRGSLYEVLGTYGVNPTFASNEVSLIYADENKASLLDVKNDTPLLFVFEVVYDQKGRPLHTSHLYILGDRFTLKL